MPLVKEWNAGDYGKAAIWKVDEPLHFFQQQTGTVSEIPNEKRRTEHLAGRFLLRHLESDFPLHAILKDDHGKPRLPGNELHFSISHSWPYIAAVVDPVNAAGIDIQVWNDKIGRIRHKYLSEEEQEMLVHDLRYFTLAWCAKESAYKWHGKQGIEFIGQLPIVYFSRHLDINIYFQQNATPQMIFLKSLMETDFACTYVDSVQDWAIY